MEAQKRPRRPVGGTNAQFQGRIGKSPEFLSGVAYYGKARTPGYSAYDPETDLDEDIDYGALSTHTETDSNAEHDSESEPERQ